MFPDSGWEHTVFEAQPHRTMTLNFKGGKLRIEYLKGNFEKRKKKNGLVYELNPPATEEQIMSKEKELSVIFPDQFKMFYHCHNGLTVKDPPLEIFPIETLTKENGAIHFSNMNHNIKICFDCTGLNDAEQWNILNCKDRYVITLTFASFWSNKIWAWIDKKREVWKQELY